MIVKVRRDDIRLHVVGRMLHRRERVDVLAEGQHHNAAGMLARAPADTGDALRQPLHLALAPVPSPLLEIILHITESGLVRQGGDGARPEGLARAEDDLRVLMGLGLVLAGEVQVDVRLLVPFEAQEGLERDVEAVLVEHLPADRTLLVRHVHPRLARVGLHVILLEVHIMALTTVIVGA